MSPWPVMKMMGMGLTASRELALEVEAARPRQPDVEDEAVRAFGLCGEERLRGREYLHMHSDGPDRLARASRMDASSSTTNTVSRAGLLLFMPGPPSAR